MDACFLPSEYRQINCPELAKLIHSCAGLVGMWRTRKPAERYIIVRVLVLTSTQYLREAETQTCFPLEYEIVIIVAQSQALLHVPVCDPIFKAIDSRSNTYSRRRDMQM